MQKNTENETMEPLLVSAVTGLGHRERGGGPGGGGGVCSLNDKQSE